MRKHMNKINYTDNQFVIYGNRSYYFVGSVSILMLLFVINLLFLLDTSDGFEGHLFLFVWIIFLVTQIMFPAFKEGSKQFTINHEGILCHIFHFDIIYHWDEIRDWGLSYYGRGRNASHIYYFYFSKKQLKTKNTKKKKLKGKLIRIELYDEDYFAILNTVIPYCKQYASVEPFICEKPKF